AARRVRVAALRPACRGVERDRERDEHDEREPASQQVATEHLGRRQDPPDGRGHATAWAAGCSSTTRSTRCSSASMCVTTTIARPSSRQRSTWCQKLTYVPWSNP